MMMFPANYVAAGGGGASFAWVADAYDTANRSTYTFDNSSNSSTGFPATLTTNAMVAIFHHVSSDTVSSVTINGMSATQRGSFFVNNGWEASAWDAPATTGATNTIVATMAATSNRLILAGVMDIGSATFQSTLTDSPTFNLTDFDLSTNTNAGDGVLLTVTGDSSGSWTWTGATEQIDEQAIGEAGRWYGAAINTSTTGGTPEDFSATGTGYTNPDLTPFGVLYR